MTMAWFSSVIEQAREEPLNSAPFGDASRRAPDSPLCESTGTIVVGLPLSRLKAVNVGLSKIQRSVQVGIMFHLHTFSPSGKLHIGLLLFEQGLEAQQAFIPFRTDILDPLLKLLERFRG